MKRRDHSSDYDRPSGIVFAVLVALTLVLAVLDPSCHPQHVVPGNHTIQWR